MAPFVPMGSFLCEVALCYELFMRLKIISMTQLRKPRNKCVICICRTSSAPWETRHQKVPAERNQSKQLCLKESQME